MPVPITSDRGKDIDSALNKDESVFRVSCFSHVINRAIIATMSSDKYYTYGIM